MAALLAVAAGAAACATTRAPVDDRRTTAPAGVVLNDRVETYAVHGRTVAEVRRSLTAEAPDATRTPGYHGVEHYTLEWRWRSATGAGIGCELRDVVVTVTSTITVPAWVPDSAAESGLAERWAAYDAALRRHERGHEALAARAAGELSRALRHVRAARCAEAANAGNELGREVLDRLRVVERQYDDSTGHGRTQGASWPPAA